MDRYSQQGASQPTWRLTDRAYAVLGVMFYAVMALGLLVGVAGLLRVGLTPIPGIG